jgi:anti-sigma regulatory factor (Ser/Thr protein kinase)
MAEVLTENAAIVATELSANMLRHAGGGELLIQVIDDEAFRGIELLAVDRGPGMSDVRRSLEDGHSTRGTSGTGLGAARRLSVEFDVHSEPGRGTIVLSRVGITPEHRALPMRWGSVASNAPGENVSGDQWAVAQQDGWVTVLMVDGLGHGPKAHDAATAAQNVFAEHSSEQPGSLLHRMHTALRTGRGAAVAIARCDFFAGSVTYAGIGNVSGIVVKPDGQQNGMVSNNGTVGADGISVKEFQYEWGPGDTFIMHTDGLKTRWSLKERPGLVARHPAIVAALLHRDYLRGRDDATVAVLSR